MTGTPDDSLLAAAQSGNRTALTQLLRKHQHGVYRYGLHVCGTTEDAQDALQEALWAATRGIGAFRGSASSLVSWMFTIIRRECFRLHERRERGPVSLRGAEDEVSAPVHDPVDAISSQRRAELLAAALQSLDPIQREVVLLRDIEELSAPEAAARLGISVQALKSRLHRARVNLRGHVLAHADRF